MKLFQVAKIVKVSRNQERKEVIFINAAKKGLLHSNASFIDKTNEAGSQPATCLTIIS